ncbi:aminoglycoside phosphotransferase family protein [Streptomyces kunmingensis]|uniref:Aminoglycoside phosphotransferase family protein n=1 Tax=Streptomyces kunmingensis TaxID=68225 RepID=A0ABU6C5K9_9ACTN|nr:aminoglycoside phosphotransferase family protein [Streptomyces kunmingensis]MEB3959610.1 aminoglycoside phosphotransferase family protein [Streptomyces kunmingensis]
MGVHKLHSDEADIDETLVRALVDEQFPRWAGLALRHVDSHGTSNVLFRLGDAYVIRLPRRSGSVPDFASERRWMPLLAARLPVAVPEPVAEGRPGHGFPYPWAVHRWLPGAIPDIGRLEKPEALAEDLAAFVDALRRIDTAGAPGAYRGRRPLAERDSDTRDVLGRLADTIDADTALAVWDAAVRAPRGPLPDVWLHSDLQPGNLLVDDGRLSAVIDFECMGTGDPAVDLIVAWYVLDAGARRVFRESLGRTDADTWARGRGWALTVAAHELAYYRESNPFMARTAARVIGEVLAEGGERPPLGSPAGTTD